ncbi:MAG: 3-oxoacyl-ACP synthase, partial [Mycobacterium sp.]|nr:3-oxoacyl-ACP synthase [Mycobacterium sp.]
MTTVSLVDVSTYLPENRVPAQYYADFAGTDDLRENLMFRAPEYRHHVHQDWTNVDMVEQATAGLLARHGGEVLGEVDILLTHSQLPDLPIMGAGGEVAHRLGMHPEWIIDVHNGGCAAFVLMVKLARQMLASGAGRTALIAVAQTCAGKVFDQSEVRTKAQSSVPGDGAAVALLRVSNESPILDVDCRFYGEYAGDMMLESDPPRQWW